MAEPDPPSTRRAPALSSPPMLGTYSSALLVLAAAAAVGQALFALCGRRWSWLAPAVGLAALLPSPGGRCGCRARGPPPGWSCSGSSPPRRPTCGGPGRGLAAARPRRRAGRAAHRPRGRLAAVPRRGPLRDPRHRAQPGHVPAPVRGRSARRDRAAERLISSGYPLGPHSLAVALAALRPEPRPGLRRDHARHRRDRRAQRRWRCSRGSRRRAGSPAPLLVGFAYMTASYLTQGAFKETMQALFVLAFAIGLGRARPAVRLAGAGVPARRSRSRCSPPARSTPTASRACSGSRGRPAPGRRSSWPGRAPGGLLAATRRPCAAGAPAPRRSRSACSWSRVAPELGGWSTSPVRDLRPRRRRARQPLQPALAAARRSGSGPRATSASTPATAPRPRSSTGWAPPWACVALAFGLWWWLRRGDRAVPVALGVAALLVAYANRRRHALPGGEGDRPGRPAGDAGQRSGRWPRPRPGPPQVVRHPSPPRHRPAVPAQRPRGARAARVWPRWRSSFTAAATLRSLLALANGPVGPSRYSPALAELRPLRGADPGPCPGGAARRRARARLPRLGAARRRGLRRDRRAARRPPPALRDRAGDRLRRSGRAAVRRHRRGAAGRAVHALGDPAADSGRLRLPVDRRRRPRRPGSDD